MRDLLDEARLASKNAIPIRSGINVGCAIETKLGDTILGWNIEGLWQTSLHAEVSAISRMQYSDDSKIKRIAIYAKDVDFTPCGACLDWLMQFGDEHTILLTSNGTKEKTYILKDLYPRYPKL